MRKLEIKIFKKEFEVSLSDGKTLVRGDMFKVSGEYGIVFKFDSLTTNVVTGSQWIDCYEMFRGYSGAQRSFTSDRIKRIPKKRVKKSVNRRSNS